MPTIAYSALVLRRPFSGVEKSVAELARALLARRAYDYRLLLPPGAGPFLPATAGQRLSAPVWCRNRAGRILHELTLLPRQVRRAGIDLFHAPAYVAPPRLPCPLVLSIYDLHVYTHPHFCTPANRLHYRARLPGSIRRAAAIIVPSRATRDILVARFPAAAAKTRVIPLGVSPAYLAPATHASQSRVRQRYSLPARFLLAVGDPTPRKNRGGIRQAWAALDLRDALVGHGLEESEVAEALSARPIEATTLSGGDGDDGLAILVGTLAAILLFITLQTFGTYVLTGVVEPTARLPFSVPADESGEPLRFGGVAAARHQRTQLGP